MDHRETARRHACADRGREGWYHQAGRPDRDRAPTRRKPWRRWRLPARSASAGGIGGSKPAGWPDCTTATGTVHGGIAKAGTATALHQIDNAGIAVAAIRAALVWASQAFRRRGARRSVAGVACSCLHGRLAALVPGHVSFGLMAAIIPGQGEVLADAPVRHWGPTHIIVGMKQAKDTAEFLRPLLPLRRQPMGGGRARAAFRPPRGGDHCGVRRDCTSWPDGG